MSKILLLEDEVVIRSEIRRLLSKSGHQVLEAGSVPEALSLLAEHAPDLVITDVRLPGAPGTDIIAASRVPVLVMTSYASVKSAVDTMKLGAADYIAKPFELDELMAIVDRLLARSRSGPPPPSRAASPKNVPPQVGGMLGQSPVMAEVFAQVRKVGPSDTTVLILGESGTGKELVAQEIHRLSKRNGRPFIAINCASIPETLVESELFGHERGAFTGAVAASAGVFDAADGGTLFLDEVGELPSAAQARLLRVLQTGEVRKVGSPRSRQVDVRLIAATHRDLAAAARDGSFRADLYYRLRVFELRLPPLRERGADAIEIARAFVARAAAKVGRGLTLTEDAERAISAHDWPGNVRELENAIERAAILADEGYIGPAHLGLEAFANATEASRQDLASPNVTSLDAYFRRFVLEHQGELGETELAKRLGISRKTLWERRQRLNLPRPGKARDGD